MNSAAPTTDFRLLLQEEFLRRTRANPRYSLRAYAKALRVAPSALSSILHARRPLTRKMVIRLGLALGLSLESLERGGPARAEVLKFSTISLDTYSVISDWYHYAILELLRVRGFRPDPAWVARSLGISRTEARIAIERLKRVGLLAIGAAGQWQDTSGDFATNIHGNLTSEASRKLQRQVLQKSLAALDELSPEVRSHTSMTMAIRADLMGHAAERIKKFRRELCAELEAMSQSQGGADQVYHLGVSLYPVSQILKEPENEAK